MIKRFLAYNNAGCIPRHGMSNANVFEERMSKCLGLDWGRDPSWQRHQRAHNTIVIVVRQSVNGGLGESRDVEM